LGYPKKLTLTKKNPSPCRTRKRALQCPPLLCHSKVKTKKDSEVFLTSEPFSSLLNHLIEVHSFLRFGKSRQPVACRLHFTAPKTQVDTYNLLKSLMRFSKNISRRLPAGINQPFFRSLTPKKPSMKSRWGNVWRYPCAVMSG